MFSKVSGSSAGPAPTTTVYADPFFLPLGSLSVSVSDPNKQLVVRGQSEQAQSMEIVSQSSEGRPLSSRSIHSATEASITMSRKTFRELREYLIKLGDNSRALKAERDLLTKDNTLLKSQIEQLKTTLDAGWTARTTSIAAKVNTLFQKLDLLNQTVTEADEQTRANLQARAERVEQIEQKYPPNYCAIGWLLLYKQQEMATVSDPAACIVSGVTEQAYSYYTNSITPLIQEVKNLQAALPHLSAQAQKEAQEAWKPSKVAPSEPASEAQASEERALALLSNETPVSEEFLDLMEEEDLQLEKENTLVRAEKLLLEEENHRLSAERTKLQEVDAQALAIYQKLVKQHLTLPTERDAQDPIRINYNMLCQSNCPTITPKLGEITTLIEEILK